MGVKNMFMGTKYREIAQQCGASIDGCAHLCERIRVVGHPLIALAEDDVILMRHVNMRQESIVLQCMHPLTPDHQD